MVSSRASASTYPTHSEVEPSPLRDRSFVVFTIGNTINNVGEAIYAIALPLLAYDLTASLTVMSLLAASTPLIMLLAPLLGACVDRWGPRTVVLPGLLLEAGAALTMNIFGLSDHADHAPIWLLFFCSLFVQLGAQAYQIGWMTGVATMFPTFRVRARGTLNTCYFATTLAGPLIVAVSLLQIGYAGLLWINLATFLAPIAVWAAGIHPPRSPVVVTRSSVRGLALADGWRAITCDRRIRTMTIVRAILAVSCGAGLTSLVIFQLRTAWQLSGTAASSVITVMSLCTFAGNIVVAQRKKFDARRSLALSTAVGVFAVFLLTASAWPVFVSALALGALASGARISANVMMTIKYLPSEVLGRASGFLGLLIGAAALLSPLLTPVLVHIFGAHWSFAILGAMSLPALWYLRRSWNCWTPDVPGVE
jgi:MFS family permease